MKFYKKNFKLVIIISIFIEHIRAGNQVNPLSQNYRIILDPN